MILYRLPLMLISPYVILLLLIYISLLRIKVFKVSHDPSIFISIIIACRNEQENLPGLLKSLSVQDYPEELFEIIIVNDNSTDRTLTVASEFNLLHNLQTISNKGTGKKLAVRTGISIAKGNLIITTDADCTMGKKWLRTIAAFYEKEKASLIICPVRIEIMPGFFGRFQSLEFLSLQGITAGSAQSGNSTMCNGANLAFEKDAYKNHMAELHDEIATGDDVFLLHSLKRDSKAKISWLESTDAMVTTFPSSTLNAYFRQRKRWISKANAYRDTYSVILGFVTFVTILIYAGTLIAGLLNREYLKIFLMIFLLKSLPDFLILKNTVYRYGDGKLMKWFLPAQAVYPFYVLLVALYSILVKKN